MMRVHPDDPMFLTLDEIQSRHPEGWLSATHSATGGFLDVRVHAKDELRVIATYQIPHPADVAALAMRSFYEVAVATLAGNGREHTMAAVAAAVGERRQNLQGALTGRGGSLDRVERWLRAWEASGLQPLRLRVSPGFAYVYAVKQIVVVVRVRPTVPHHMAEIVRQLEGRLAGGGPDLGGVARFGSDIDLNGWVLTYQTSAESESVARAAFAAICSAVGAHVESVREV